MGPKNPVWYLVNRIKEVLGLDRTMTAPGSDVIDAVNRQSDQIANKIDKGGSASLVAIEFNTSSGAGHGGYIDFHYNGDSSDNTSRIIENGAGQLNINGTVFSNNHIILYDYTKNINLVPYLGDIVHVTEYLNATIYGNMVFINIGGLYLTSGTTSRSVFTLPNSVPTPKTRPLGVVANDTDAKTSLIYGGINSRNFDIAKHEENVRYYGFIIYFYDF